MTPDEVVEKVLPKHNIIEYGGREVYDFEEGFNEGIKVARNRLKQAILSGVLVPRCKDCGGKGSIETCDDDGVYEVYKCTCQEPTPKRPVSVSKIFDKIRRSEWFRKSHIPTHEDIHKTAESIAEINEGEGE